MKKYLLLFVLLLTACKSVQPDYVLNNDVFCDGLFETNQMVTCLDAGGKPVNGLIHGYFDDGNKSAELTVENGIPTGVVKLYHSNKKLKQETKWKNGAKNGWHKVYHENGRLHIKVRFENNIPQDTIVTYHPDGKLRARSQLKNGHMNGFAETYYPNGKLLGEHNMLNDVRNGLSYEYNEDGTLYRILTYKNGVPDGAVKTYYKNGNLYKQGTLKNGELDGELKEYYEDGQLKSTSIFVQGKLSGTPVEYAPTDGTAANAPVVAPVKKESAKQTAPKDEKKQTTPKSEKKQTKQQDKKQSDAKKTKSIPTPDAKKYKVTARVLNVRAGPDKNKSVIGKLKRGTIVRGYPVNSSWLKIQFKGGAGYVSRSYMQKYSIWTAFDPSEIVAFLVMGLLALGLVYWISTSPGWAFVVILVLIIAIISDISEENGANLIWLVPLTICLAILLILCNGHYNRCKECGKWWALREVGRSCIDSSPCTITEERHVRNSKGNIIYSYNVDVPGTEYTDEIKCRCRYCRNVKYRYKTSRYKN